MRFSIVTVACVVKSTLAFAPIKTQHSCLPSTLTSTGTSVTPPTPSTLQMAGFGGGGGMGASKKKGKKGNKTSKTVVLKPKAQWDRYAALKKASAVKVAVRVANEGGDAGEWYEVGKVKSEGDEFTEIALMVQRGVIAEHAKRLFPLQFRIKDQVEWAFTSTPTPEQEDWTTVDKSVTADAPAGIEKRIGFEGTADVGTGFYCHYQDGKLTDRYAKEKSAVE